MTDNLDHKQEFDHNISDDFDSMVEYKLDKHLNSSYGDYNCAKHHTQYPHQIYDAFNWIFYCKDLKSIHDKVFPTRITNPDHFTQLFCDTFRYFYRLTEHESHDKQLEIKILDNPVICSQQSFKLAFDEIKHLNLLYRRYGQKESDRRNRICGLFANAHTIDELNCDIRLLSDTSDEYNIIHRYVTNSGENYFIKHILKIERKTENQSFKRFESCKRMLLFHGTPIYNCYSILLNGLKVTSLWHQKGVGLYFADMPQKSYHFSQKSNGFISGKCYDFVIVFVCDVAVGNMDGTGLPNGYTCVRYDGISCRDITDVAVIDNAIVPYGKPTGFLIQNNSIDQFGEYFVADSEQVKLKYMIVFRKA